MIKRTYWLAGVLAGTVIFGGVCGGVQPARAAQAVTYNAYTNMYGGLLDPSNTATNISVYANKAANGSTGRFSWTVKGKTFPDC